MAEGVEVDDIFTSFNLFSSNTEPFSRQSSDNQALEGTDPTAVQPIIDFASNAANIMAASGSVQIYLPC